MRMILVYGVCFLLVFLGAGLCGQAADTTLTPPVHNLPNVAHRGASYSYPENTIAAYRAAINAGANGAECDVYKTADNALVLSHDRTTKRTMGGENKDITKLTLEEIRKLDAGIWKGKDFKGEKVPTLEEYLLLLKNTTCRPVIEIKMEGIETLV
ncbi:MAG: hypothetical protein LBQ66_05790, partial [Planctomycetaceae bacterium]|nr:hypothetical protein [Planctomycetaceae bacterium]